MTTIAYRNGLMAGDTRAYSGSKYPIGRKSKIKRLQNGTLIGVSSTTPGGGEYVANWYETQDSSLILPDAFSLLAVHLNGDVFFATDHKMLSGPLKADFFAIGSGCDFALGAMEMGASAQKAVEVSCYFDVWSDLPVEVWRLQ